jgi:hypothetical protein
MAIRRFDPGSVKASTPVSDALYRDTSPPFRLERLPSMIGLRMSVTLSNPHIEHHL